MVLNLHVARTSLVHSVSYAFKKIFWGALAWLYCMHIHLGQTGKFRVVEYKPEVSCSISPNRGFTIYLFFFQSIKFPS